MAFFKFLMLLTLTMGLSSCGGSGGSTDATPSAPSEADTTENQITNPTEEPNPDEIKATTEATGTILVKFNNPNSSNDTRTLQAKLSARAYDYQASGKLVATANTLANIAASAEIEQNIETQSDGSVLIQNVPITANGALVLQDTANNQGIALDQIAVRKGEQTEISVDIEPLFNQTILIRAATNFAAQLTIPMLEQTIDFTTNQEFVLPNAPKGRYAFQIKANNKVLSSQILTLSAETATNSRIIIDIQNVGYQLKGKVTDSTNQAIAGALVMLKDTDGNHYISATDTNGDYSVDNLPPNLALTLSIQKTGYQPKQVQNIQLTADTTWPTQILNAQVTSGSITGYAYFQGKAEHVGIDITIEKVDDTSFNTNQLGTLKDGAFIITGLPDGQYILHFGKSNDSLYSQEDSAQINVIAGVTSYLETPIILQEKDANPPVITGHNLVFAEESPQQDERGRYILNPGKTLQVDFSAQDLDNDPITYSAFAPAGSTVLGNPQIGKLNYTTPSEGGIYTLTLTAQSKYKTANLPITLWINAAPTILKLSEADFSGTDPFNLTAGNELLIQTSIQDDLDLTQNLHIEWSSNIQGKLAENTETLKTILLPGSHAITLKVTDSLGLENSAIFYVKVIPLGLVWLKAPDAGLLKTYFDSIDGRALLDSYSLNIQTDYNLSYHSNNESVATVSSTGTIQAVDAGTTTIDIISNEVNENNEPEYQYQVVVRVLDKVNTSDSNDLTLSPGQIRQIRINQAFTLNLQNLVEGSYEIKLFDEKENIADSTSATELAVNGTLNKTLNNTGFMDIEVLDLHDQFTLRFSSSNNGDEFIKVGLFPSANTVDADSRFLHIAAWDDNYEPNDVRSLAAEIQVNQAIEANLNQDKTDTVDWYKLPNLLPGSYQVVFEGMEGTYYPSNSNTLSTLKFYNAQGILEKTESFYAGTPKEFVLEVENQGNYYIKVVRDNNYATNYRLQINSSISNGLVQDAKLEPNNFDFQAAPINLAEALENDLNVQKTDFSDFYQVRNLQPGFYEFIYQGLPGSETNENINIGLYAPSGNLLDEIQSFNGSTANHFALEIKDAGNYVIKLNRNANAKTYYRISVNPSVANGLIHNQYFEPNNYAFQAAPIGLNAFISANLNSSQGDTVDYYQLTEIPAGTYRFIYQAERSSQSDNDDVYIDIYDGNNTLLASQTFGDKYGGQFSFSLAKKANYLIKIRRQNNGLTYYRFGVYPSNANGLVQDDQYEPNNVAFQASPLNLNESLFSDINIYPHDTEDWFKIQLPAGNYQLTFTTINSYNDYYYYHHVQLYSADLNAFFSEYYQHKNVGVNTKIPIHHKESQEIFIRISNSENFWSRYSLAITPSTE